MNSRKAWLDAMLIIANPVLTHLAAGTLKQAMPCQFHPDRAEFMHLEALGRTVCGMAPWLELEGLCGEEAQRQEAARALTRQAIRMAVHPESPDYMNFSRGYGQALVDAAFLAHGVIRAPRQLFALLDEQTKRELAQALRDTRRFTPFVTNWLFFSAMIEAALYVMGEPDYDLTRVDYAVNMFEGWYLGDGHYGDGPQFHWDYYNSFVIHPMYVDILRTFADVRPRYAQLLPACLERAGRYAQILERLINADGTYPVIGRSVTYRFGAFHLLAQAALQGFLPPELKPAQVRCALSAVLSKVMENPTMFDAQGWLQPGVYGLQPDLAEDYICEGSLYLCESVFLPLGLPQTHEFWSGADLPWTAKRIWQGENMPCDHALS